MHVGINCKFDKQYGIIKNEYKKRYKKELVWNILFGVRNGVIDWR